ncbi:Uncharacterised protein [Neisseria meningitidis]|uniref:Uncharacterized protein n=2 Tax=Neisseria meningitidis TaxID=487 RepID=X5EQB8_NEIME|nr:MULTISPECIES: hypothetical protein [Pseudomonadota]EOB88671.1 hypothetical protein NM604_0317 [Neisseria meningitidis NM604]AHW75184.1 hypothetical protein NMA510612_0882 [Neisseria meningitidis]AOT28377.1 hypothetical protein AN159_00140 [Neisseria meningitidis]ARC05337.1 hypothetical protein A6J48_04475 [Neisseria meningitidis]ELK66972.1 hypothetical protein NM88050_0682 [Neisseria meningitidis 88050]
MCIAFYTVNPDQYEYEKSRAYIVRIFVNDEIVETTVFPITNPQNTYKTRQEAEEYGRLTVKALMDKQEKTA